MPVVITFSFWDCLYKCTLYMYLIVQCITVVPKQLFVTPCRITTVQFSTTVFSCE